MNNKITIYELLGLVKNEQAPKKIRYINLIWEYDDEVKDYISDDLYLFYKINGIGLIQNYVEILDNEDEDIEEIDFKTAETQKEKNRIMKIKINELVKEVNKLKKEGK